MKKCLWFCCHLLCAVSLTSRLTFTQLSLLLFPVPWSFSPLPEALYSPDCVYSTYSGLLQDLLLVEEITCPPPQTRQTETSVLLYFSFLECCPPESLPTCSPWPCAWPLNSLILWVWGFFWCFHFSVSVYWTSRNFSQNYGMCVFWL